MTSLSKTMKHISVLVIGIVLARWLTPEQFGSYLQVQLIVTSLLYLAIFGFPHSIYYFIPRSAQPRGFMLRTIVIMFGIAGLVATGIYFSTGWIAEKLNNPDIAGFAAITAGMLFFQIPIKLFEPLMLTLKRVPTFVRVNFTFNFAFLFAVLIPTLMGASLAGILLSMLLFYIVQFAVIYAVILRTTAGLKPSSELATEFHSLAEQLRYSVPIGFSGAIGEVSRIVDKAIVGSYFTPATYAMYTRGAMQIPLINVVTHSLSNILMPNFVAAYKANDIPKLMQIWHSAIKMMAVFVYPCFFYFVGTADFLIPALFSDKYAEAAIIFQVYSFTLLTRLTTYDAIIRAVGRTGVLLKISVFAIVVNIVGTIALIEQFGIIGAPAATVITVYCTRLLYLKVITGMLDVTIPSVFPWRVLATLIAISALALAAGSCIRLLVDLPHIPMLALIGLVFAPVYLGLLRLSGLLNAQERDALSGVLPKKLRWMI